MSEKNISVGHKTDIIQTRRQKLSQNAHFMIEKSFTLYRLSIINNLSTCPIHSPSPRLPDLAYIASRNPDVLSDKKVFPLRQKLPTTTSDNKLSIPLYTLSISSLAMLNSSATLFVGPTLVSPVFRSTLVFTKSSLLSLNYLACRPQNNWLFIIQPKETQTWL